MLRRVYDYLAGHYQRQHHQQKIEHKKEEVNKLTLEIQAMRSESTDSTVDTRDLAPKSYKLDQRNPIEVQTDSMFKAKDELIELEEKFKQFEEQPHTIGLKDIDIVLKRLGVTMPKKNIEVILLLLI